MKNIKFIAIIPARYGSSRFEGKPLAKICGIAMIERVYKRVKEHFDYCVVATDDIRIEECVKNFGGEVIMTSTSHTSGTDRVAEAAEKAKELFGEDFNVIVNIQGDEPFVSFEQLKAIKECFDSEDIQIATIVKRFGENEDIFNENSPKVALSKTMFALYFSRSVIPFMRGVSDRAKWQQNAPFYKHIGLYAYRSEVLKEITALETGELERLESLEQLRWLENGYKIKVAECNTESHAIDTPEDLELVESLYSSQLI